LWAFEQYALGHHRNVSQHSQTWLVKCNATLLNVVGHQDVMDFTILSHQMTPSSSASRLKLKKFYLKCLGAPPHANNSLFQPHSPYKKAMLQRQGRQQFLIESWLSVRCPPTKFTVEQHHSNKILKIRHVTSASSSLWLNLKVCYVRNALVPHYTLCSVAQHSLACLCWLKKCRATM